MNCNNIIDCLLSLNLLDYKDKNKYIKTIYSISNNIENNYKSYRIKKEMVIIELYVNLIKY